MNFRIFPKVFAADKAQRIFIKLSEPVATGASVKLKVQPMESYGIEHTPRYRIDEEERYPYVEAKREGEDLYSLEYDFFSEQKYNVRVKIDGCNLGSRQYVYSVGNDLLRLNPLKCDTHLHTCRSDGDGTPFEVGISYRSKGYDFIAVTDHHKMQPSLEAKEQFAALTDKFFVIRAEEVHNKGMGYFHIINLGGEFSVNEIIEAEDGFAEREVERYLKDEYPEGTTPYICAYRRFVSDMIRRGGGVAVMAHPFWECFGEYNMPSRDVRYLLKSGCYDAVELLAACDQNGNGNDMLIALWQEILYEGVRVPVLGASDSHNATDSDTLFNKQFSIVFAEGEGDVLEAVKQGRTVAVRMRDVADFTVFGSFRLVKYARFLLDEYFPEYVRLAANHASALMEKDNAVIAAAEREIEEYQGGFFAR